VTATTPHAPDPRRWKALALLGVAYLMVVLDISVVNVALPRIQSGLHFGSLDSLQWVVSGYALTFGGLLLLGGRLGDLLGRRRVFVAGLILFSTFSLLAGLSTSAGMLIAMRVLQGAAGAILSPSVFSITSVTFEEGAELNKALGILGAIAASGAAIGVLAGGVLTQYAGWEWCFFVNVPIGVGTCLLVPRYLHESHAHDLARHFDASGAATVTGHLMLLVFALTQANSVGWASAQTIGVLLASALLGIAFLVIETRSPSPLVPLRFFRRRTPTGANIVGFLLGTAIFGMFFLLSLYMGQILDYSPVETGVGYLGVALTVIFAAGVSQALVTRFGVKPVLAVGMLLTAVGLAYFTRLAVHGSYFADLFPGFLLIGVGMGFSFIPVSIAALGGIDPHEAGLASGLINTSQQIGGALGLAILTTVSTSRTDNVLNGIASPTSTDRASAAVSGYTLAFWVAVAFAAVGVFATLLALRREELGAEPGEAALAAE
jgi:EmrB/QacA subfamily drug resistance transporter